jgi:lysophospholipase L1-like esterase
LFECLVLGDSIAVGVGRARPECAVVAASGITSERFVQTLHARPWARTVIVSLGVNDGDGVPTIDNLRLLRRAIAADTVYWLLAGSNPRARDAARVVARQYRDRLIDVAPLAGPDHVHPDRTGYAVLARETGGSTRPPSTARHMLTTRNDFRAFPSMQVWNGPGNLNGVPVRR